MIRILTIFISTKIDVSGAHGFRYFGSDRRFDSPCRYGLIIHRGIEKKSISLGSYPKDRGRAFPTSATNKNY